MGGCRFLLSWSILEDSNLHKKRRRMKDMVIVITGASDGIGYAAAKNLKELGATVIIVGRTPHKTKDVAKKLQVPFYVVDFSHLDEVRTLASSLAREYPKIDVLINNAGGIFSERTLTSDGFEQTFQVNYLAPFLLTHLLIDTLLASHATIINTSSVANQMFAKFDISDLGLKKGYSANKAYGNAKLANILFTKELHNRYFERGISTASFHPGLVATNFAQGSSSFLSFIYRTPLRRVFGLISPEKGADTMLFLATTKPGELWISGEHYYKKKPTSVNPLALDSTVSRELWQISSTLLGL